MGRKLGSSNPMVIDVLLAPLDESFCIVPSDTTQQWYYENDGSYLPDRAATSPLLLTPQISVFDVDTSRSYTPSMYLARWYYKPISSETYTEITNTSETPSAEYVKLPNGQLKVKKNVLYDAPITIRCDYTYVDPRNNDVTNTTVSETVDLVTNRDASVVSPTIEIDTDSTEYYNLFVDQSSRFTFNAKVHFGYETVLSKDKTSTKYRVLWYAKGDGGEDEQLIDATQTDSNTGITANRFPCYVSGQNTVTLTLDAMWTEGITIIARVQEIATSKIFPEKAFRSLCWDSINIDANTVAVDGGDIRSKTESKTFKNIVNMRGRNLSDAQVSTNFIQDFKYRKASKTKNGQTPTDSVSTIGFGPQVTVNGNELRNNSSALVFSELKLLGCNKVITSDGTRNGTVYYYVDNGVKKIIVCRT